MRLKQIRIEKGRQQKELGEAIGTSESMMSRFENYKCLPVPKMMDMLVKELDCSIEDIYEPNEIYIQPAKKNTPADESDEIKFYRLTANLPRDARDFLKVALKKCGYKDITYWIYRCFERLQKQYEIILKAEQDKVPK